MGRRTLVLIVALLLAGVAAFAVYRFLTGVQNERIEQTALEEVYRTQARIEAGTSGDLVIQQFDERLEVSEEVVELTPELAVDTEPIEPGEVSLEQALAGNVAAGPIPAGVVVTTDMWIDPVQAAQSLDEVVSSGNQAVSVPVEASRGVAGFIRPGDTVNVLVTLKVEGTPITEDAPALDPQQESGSGEPETITKTLTRYVLFNKHVLAVDDQVVIPGAEDSATVAAPAPTPSEDGSATTPTTPQTGGGNGSLVDRVQLVTLEVNSEEAEQLVFAVEAGDIWLTLATDDFQPANTGGVVIDSLFGEDGGVLDEYFETGP